MELVKILNLSNKSEWNDVLSKFPERLQDIYFSPEYYQLNQDYGFGEAICFFLRDGDDVLIYPFLKNSIKELKLIDLEIDYFDIQGPLGYNGAVTNSVSIDFINRFSKTFKEYCINNNIISEFVRFHPILGNHNISRYIEPVKVNSNIIVDLTLSKKNIWLNAFNYSVRKNVRKAQRNGLIVKCIRGSDMSDGWIDTFYSIYLQTMTRRHTDDKDIISLQYFRLLKETIPDKSLFFFTMKNEKIFSCELVTYNRNNAYSFLGGTLSEYFPLRPNDILKYEIIFQLKEMGLKYYCLGGGKEENDGIFRYKKGFSRQGEVDFYIGKNIYNKTIYDEICKAWEIKYAEKKHIYSNMLLKYRQ